MSAFSTISDEVHQNTFNKNKMIEKKFLRQKWVLRINEQEDPKKNHHRKLLIFIFVSVLISVIIALCCGIIFSLDYSIFRVENKNTPRNYSDINSPENNNYYSYNNNDKTNKTDEIKKTSRIMLIPKKVTTTETNGIENKLPDIQKAQKDQLKIAPQYCLNCTRDEEICMKIAEMETPKCIKIIDKNDSTGCGGFCKINTEYCKNLDKFEKVFQCLPVKKTLKCPNNTFNCENMCIPLKSRCDGKIDCSNMLDENNCDCNLTTHFQCGNETSCLDNSKTCDGKVDCWDKSDEINCRREVFCEEEDHIPCLNGQCIHKEKMCDQIYDCDDKTDEPIWCQEIIKHI